MRVSVNAEKWIKLHAAAVAGINTTTIPHPTSMEGVELSVSLLQI
jgi:hypothetical protein